VSGTAPVLRTACLNVSVHRRWITSACQPLPGGCSQQIEEEDTLLCKCVTMVHTCAVTQARSQLPWHASNENCFLGKPISPLVFFSQMKADAAFADCLTACLVLYRVRAWFTLRLSRFRRQLLREKICPLVPCYTSGLLVAFTATWSLCQSFAPGPAGFPPGRGVLPAEFPGGTLPAAPAMGPAPKPARGWVFLQLRIDQCSLQAGYRRCQCARTEEPGILFYLGFLLPC